MYIATIDGGTTNTRVLIWQDGAIKSEAKTSVGVRNTAIDGSNAKLVAAVRSLLSEAVRGAGIALSDISLILAAGMLTSNVGLIEIPHVAAPVTVKELAGSMVCAEMNAIADKPIWFVPGVKNLAPEAMTIANRAAMDMMRGEEAQSVGMLGFARSGKKTVFVFPGSHHKFVLIDEKQSIRGCLTTLAGEALNSLTFDTVLADTLARSFALEFDEKSFLMGVEDALSQGFLHAAFMTRILGVNYGFTPSMAQNYVLGIILADELKALKTCSLFGGLEDAVFVLTGKSVMQKAYACLFKREQWDCAVLSEKEQEGLSGRGAIALAGMRGLLG